MKVRTMFTVIVVATAAAISLVGCATARFEDSPTVTAVVSHCDRTQRQNAVVKPDQFERAVMLCSLLRYRAVTGDQIPKKIADEAMAMARFVDEGFMTRKEELANIGASVRSFRAEEFARGIALGAASYNASRPRQLNINVRHY